MDIKSDPEKEAHAKAKLKTLQDEYDANVEKQKQTEQPLNEAPGL